MISPAQCRAARALLGISQQQLAEESCVSLRTVQGFEAGKRPIQSLTMTAIVRVLAGRGVVIESDETWLGVRIERSHQPS